MDQNEKLLEKLLAMSDETEIVEFKEAKNEFLNSQIKCNVFE